jgi:hypothetical protein
MMPRFTPIMAKDDAQFRICGEFIMKSNLIGRLVLAFCLGAMITPADSLELKNGSLIKGRYLGGTGTEIRLQVGSSVQRYDVPDVVSLKFVSETSK